MIDFANLPAGNKLVVAKKSTVDVPSRPVQTQCVHLGEVVAYRQCDTCRGRVQLKVFDCHVHGLIVLSDCFGCSEYKGME